MEQSPRLRLARLRNLVLETPGNLLRQPFEGCWTNWQESSARKAVYGGTPSPGGWSHDSSKGQLPMGKCEGPCLSSVRDGTFEFGIFAPATHFGARRFASLPVGRGRADTLGTHRVARGVIVALLVGAGAKQLDAMASELQSAERYGCPETRSLWPSPNADYCSRKNISCTGLKAASEGPTSKGTGWSSR